VGGVGEAFIVTMKSDEYHSRGSPNAAQFIAEKKKYVGKNV
jgi:hypothetical protein